MILVMAAAAVLLLALVVKILRAPLRWALKLLLNAAVGFVVLIVLNFFGDAVGISLGVNWLNAIVTGVLGFPGILLLLLIKYLL